MSDQVFLAVAPTSDITEKSISIYDVMDTSIVICRLRNEYFALENRCSHALSSFADGRLRGYHIICPLHGATFDIRDGSCTGAPAKKPIRSFPLRIVDGVVEIKISANGS